MTIVDKPADVEHVACETCLKEIPISEATVPEATDYVVYFCGLECYEKWRRQIEAVTGPQKECES